MRFKPRREGRHMTSNVIKLTPSAHSNAVVDWFAHKFSELHPLLQDLHRNGGQLHGTVQIEIPTGVAGLLGRRLAKKLGVPTTNSSPKLDVSISHTDGLLHWHRTFDDNMQMRSIFKPVGNMDSGYWLDDTGPLELKLTVDILDGGWYWRCLSMRLWKIPLPLWLFPHSKAYKKIEGDKYRFYVSFSLLGLGTILSYSGLLDAHTAYQPICALTKPPE